MKKILSILSAVAISATASSLVVSCGNSSKGEDKTTPNSNHEGDGSKEHQAEHVIDKIFYDGYYQLSISLKDKNDIKKEYSKNQITIVGYDDEDEALVKIRKVSINGSNIIIDIDASGDELKQYLTYHVYIDGVEDSKYSYFKVSTSTAKIDNVSYDGENKIIIRMSKDSGIIPDIYLKSFCLIAGSGPINGNVTKIKNIGYSSQNEITVLLLRPLRPKKETSYFVSFISIYNGEALDHGGFTVKGYQ